MGHNTLSLLAGASLVGCQHVPGQPHSTVVGPTDWTTVPADVVVECAPVERKFYHFHLEYDAPLLRSPLRPILKAETVAYPTLRCDRTGAAVTLDIVVRFPCPEGLSDEEVSEYLVDARPLWAHEMEHVVVFRGVASDLVGAVYETCDAAEAALSARMATARAANAVIDGKDR